MDKLERKMLLLFIGEKGKYFKLTANFINNYCLCLALPTGKKHSYNHLEVLNLHNSQIEKKTSAKRRAME